jgi:hypothetical protein
VAPVVAPPAPSRDVLDLRALSAGQLQMLDRDLRRCEARTAGAGGVAVAARFRECAFRTLAHNSLAQRFNATLAVTLTHGLRGGCKARLLSLAGMVRAVADEAEAMLRELNSRVNWSRRERRNLHALRALARDIRAGLPLGAWRRDCTDPGLTQLVE